MPASKASDTNGLNESAYVWAAGGRYVAPRRKTAEFCTFDTGDVITITLDLDASTVAFSKNSTLIVQPQDIARGDATQEAHSAYVFVFAGARKGDAVTIIEEVG